MAATGGMWRNKKFIPAKDVQRVQGAAPRRPPQLKVAGRVAIPSGLRGQMTPSDVRGILQRKGYAVSQMTSAAVQQGRRSGTFTVTMQFRNGRTASATYRTSEITRQRQSGSATQARTPRSTKNSYAPPTQRESAQLARFNRANAGTVRIEHSPTGRFYRVWYYRGQRRQSRLFYIATVALQEANRQTQQVASFNRTTIR